MPYHEIVVLRQPQSVDSHWKPPKYAFIVINRPFVMFVIDLEKLDISKSDPGYQVLSILSFRARSKVITLWAFLMDIHFMEL